MWSYTFSPHDFFWSKQLRHRFTSVCPSHAVRNNMYLYLTVQWQKVDSDLTTWLFTCAGERRDVRCRYEANTLLANRAVISASKPVSLTCIGVRRVGLKPHIHRSSVRLGKRVRVGLIGPVSSDANASGEFRSNSDSCRSKCLMFNFNVSSEALTAQKPVTFIPTLKFLHFGPTPAPCRLTKLTSGYSSSFRIKADINGSCRAFIFWDVFLFSWCFV